MMIYIQIIFSIAAIVVAFFSRIWPWIIIALPLAWFSSTALAIKLHPKPRYIDELSRVANELFQRWFLFYSKPFAGTDFSSASSGISVTAIILSIIGCFYGFYIGVIIGIVVYFYSAVIARIFNPTHFLSNEAKFAHAEVCGYMEHLREQAYYELKEVEEDAKKEVSK